MALLDNFIHKKETWANIRALSRELGAFLGGLILVTSFVLLSIITQASKEKSQVLGEATDAQFSLEQGQFYLSNSSLDQAALHFREAAQKFADLEKRISNLSKVLSPLDSATLDAASNLSVAGSSIAAAGTELTTALDSLSSMSQSLANVLSLDTSRGTPIDSNNQFNLHEALRTISGSLAWTKQLLSQAVSAMDDVNSDVLPEEYKEPIIQSKSEVKNILLLVGAIENFNSLLVDLTAGFDRTYLLIFQNTSEARATGGFIGSYGLLRIKGGAVQSLLIESVYEIDGRLRRNIPAPEPFQQAGIPFWGLRDANFWPDWPMSARNIAQFYEWEGGESVDGILGVTPAIAERILKILGPIKLRQYNITVDADNFYEVTQVKTSVEYDKRLNLPKKFMSDLSKAMIARLNELTAEEKLLVFASLFESIEAKDLLIYSRDVSIQEKIVTMGADGSMADLRALGITDGLLVTHTNLGGNKSDGLIKTDISIDTHITQPGNAKHKVTVKRANEFSADYQFNGTNLDYLRIYLPLSARNVSANFEYETFIELGRRVVAGFVRTEPLGSSEAVVEYEVGFDNTLGSYTFLFEKNPGQKVDKLMYNLEVPESLELVHSIGDGQISERRFESEKTNLTKDLFWGFVYKNK